MGYSFHNSFKVSFNWVVLLCRYMHKHGLHHSINIEWICKLRHCALQEYKIRYAMYQRRIDVHSIFCTVLLKCHGLNIMYSAFESSIEVYIYYRCSLRYSLNKYSNLNNTYALLFIVPYNIFFKKHAHYLWRRLLKRENQSMFSLFVTIKMFWFTPP